MHVNAYHGALFIQKFQSRFSHRDTKKALLQSLKSRRDYTIANRIDEEEESVVVSWMSYGSSVFRDLSLMFTFLVGLFLFFSCVCIGLF